MPTHLLYLHGFRSSPASAKARCTAARVHTINDRRVALGLAPIRWICPQLPPSPREAVALALSLVADAAPGQVALIGSSLGGFYATWLARTLDSRAALLNPAVNPARDLRGQIGELADWHDPGLRFTFTAEHVAELEGLVCGTLTEAVSEAERYLAVIARDDSVLDWREMAARYQGATLRIVDHGGHALDDYAQRHLDTVLDFLGVAAPSTAT